MKLENRIDMKDRQNELNLMIIYRSEKTDLDKLDQTQMD